MATDNCPAYWLREASSSNATRSLPFIITLAVFERSGSSVEWQLLPGAVQTINEIIDTQKREGVISYKQHAGKPLSELTSHVKKLLKTPAASQGVLVIFAQDGEVAEKTLKFLRDDELLSVEGFDV